MFDNNTITAWGCILLAGVVSYLLRVVPVLFHRGENAPARVHPFFEYASYALIGGIIATSAFGAKLTDMLEFRFSASFWIVLVSLLVTFMTAVKSKRPVLSLGVGISLYATLRALL
jgi:branched-subunit amino acid transport protein